MPRFVFRLDPVLEHRERIENERHVVFAAAMNRLADAERVRDDLIVRRDSMRERLHSHHGEMDSDELRATYAHCDYLDRSIIEQEAVVKMARDVANAERARLLEATKGKKILETLKEHRREVHETEAAAREQAETDDINARRFDRVQFIRETAQ